MSDSLLTCVTDGQGTNYWYFNDKLHRTDGPAIEYSSGAKYWYINGMQLTKKDFDALTNSMTSTSTLPWVPRLPITSYPAENTLICILNANIPLSVSNPYIVMSATASSRSAWTHWMPISKPPGYAPKPKVLIDQDALLSYMHTRLCTQLITAGEVDNLIAQYITDHGEYPVVT